MSLIKKLICFFVFEQFIFSVLCFFEPVLLIASVPEQSFMRNDQIAAKLKTMGLKLVFEKIPKEKKEMCLRVMFKDVPNQGKQYRTNIMDIIGHDGELETQYNVALRDRKGKLMGHNVMCKVVDKNDNNRPTRLLPGSNEEGSNTDTE